MIIGEEFEWKCLVKELYDGLGGMLFNLKLVLSFLENKMNVDIGD